MGRVGNRAEVVIPLITSSFSRWWHGMYCKRLYAKKRTNTLSESLPKTELDKLKSVTLLTRLVSSELPSKP